MKRTFRQFLAASATGFLGTIIAALTVIALARLLLPKGYGFFTVTFSIITIVNLLADTGIGGAVAKYAAELDRDEDIVWTGFLVDSTITLTFFAITIASASLIASGMNKPIGNLIIICSLYMLPCSFDIFFARIQAKRRIELMSALSLGYTALCGFLSVGFVLLGFGVIGAIMGYIIAKLITTLITLKTMWVRGRFRWEIGKKLFRYGLFLYISSLATFATSGLDKIILGFVVAGQTIGEYSVAQGLAGYISYIPMAYGTVVFPIVSKAQADGNEGKIRKIYETGIIGSGIYVILVLIGSFILGGFAIKLVFGTTYLPATNIFRVCMFANAFSSITVIALTIMNAMGKPSLSARLVLIQGVTAIILFPVLAVFFGAVGAALADTLIQFLGMILSIYLAKKHMKLHVKFSSEAIISFFRLLVQQAGLV